METEAREFYMGTEESADSVNFAGQRKVCIEALEDYLRSSIKGMSVFGQENLSGLKAAN